jgi:hypothetical protein
MYGGYRQSERGYLEYATNMARFGSEKAWREARREDFRATKRMRERHADWHERNHIPLSSVRRASTLRRGGGPGLVPKLDKDGYPFRKDEVTHRRSLAKRKRIEAEALRAEAKRKVEEKRARRAFKQGLSFTVPTDVADWCIQWGIIPNDDRTVTLIKATDDSYMSKHGARYLPGTTVVDDRYDRTPSCGGGLHFAATAAISAGYQGFGSGEGEGLRILECRVPLNTLIPLGDKCKAESCYVEKDVTP